jgi:regulator of protease activity HflC (stomatin/prohibitin superfamily)
MLDFVGAITGTFVVVYDGQHSLKFTLGRAGEVVGPGVHWKWPIVQKYETEETKHTTLDLEPQVIQLADDLVYEVDCKVMYQIVDLRKAKIEIDDLVTGLKNRVVLAIQNVLRRRDRRTIREADAMVREILGALAPVEEQWGVQILQLGFSNISPSPTTLEITQLELLANEKLALYQRMRAEGLSDAAAVALIAGAVVALQPEASAPTRAQELRDAKAELARDLGWRPAQEPAEGDQAEAGEDEDEDQSGGGETEAKGA